MGYVPNRSLGSIYTPPDFADFLTQWAVQTCNQNVLDVGVGEGVFTFAIFKRLIALGASSVAAQSQVYGAEIDVKTYDRFLQKAAAQSLEFGNIQFGDFFDLSFPQVDAITGNPPYVRRAYLTQTGVRRIRRSVTESNPSVDEYGLNALTDLYVYFLLRAMPLLKPGGRLAVITADSWLNTAYGACFKEQLHGSFNIERLVSFDRKVFNASVKPVLILATKRPSKTSSKAIEFVRLKNGLPIKDLPPLLNYPPKQRPSDLLTIRIKRATINADEQWGKYFKAPVTFEQIRIHKSMTSLSKLGMTRIGIQTLAKDFFVLTRERAKKLKIERRFLRPLAPSTRYFKDAILETTSKPLFYLFYCSQPKKELKGTHALAYIKQGETTRVPVRGKRKTVLGYHKKKRIQEDKRRYWYDLKSALLRRGRGQILIPRLVYRTFNVVWNRAGFVPGELFIEFLPNKAKTIEREVYLAALSSSLAEVMLRSAAQIYGAGTYNISPGLVRETPILNVELLTNEQKSSLKSAYLTYVTDPQHDRAPIDNVIYGILGIDSTMRTKLAEILDDMHLLATSARQTGSIHH